MSEREIGELRGLVTSLTSEVEYIRTSVDTLHEKLDGKYVTRHELTIFKWFTGVAISIATLILTMVDLFTRNKSS